MATIAATSMNPARPASVGLYQAVWRWHFVAGLLVLPFLVMMAITGSLYLFKDELTLAAYPGMVAVTPQAVPPAKLSTLVASTERATGGSAVWITLPDRPDRSVSMMIRRPVGDVLTAYANPYDGRFLGATPFGGIMHVVRKIHSLQRFGFWASCIIELVAGWTVILVVTGFYMWWPRGQAGGVTRVRGRPRARVFWRDIHAITGSIAGVVILFLALTGMTWSLLWGVSVQRWVIMHQLYAPHAPGFTLPEEVVAAMKMPAPVVPPPAEKIPWSLDHMPQPRSTGPGARVAPAARGGAMGDMGAMNGREHAAHLAMAGGGAGSIGAGGTPIGVDRALARFRQLGVHGGFGLAMPIGEHGIYAANVMPRSVRGNRMVYLDQYSGKSLGEMRFADYYAGGAVIEMGNNIHMGREFGAANRYVMLAAALSVILLAISSVTMWWKRRPTGKLGLPPYPTDPRVARGLVIIIAVFGLIFPLVGMSLIVAFIIDRAIAFARRAR